MNNTILTFLIFAFLTASCLPEQAGRQPVSSQSNLGDSSGEETDAIEDNLSHEDLYWRDAGVKYSTLTIDYNNQKNHYIFGSDVDSFLKTSANYNATYCVFATFNTGSAPSAPLMVKATPAITTNYSTGARTRYFRVNLSTATGNDFCNKNALIKRNPLTIVPFASLVYKPSSVCPTCLNIVASNSLELYRYNQSEDWLELIGLDQIAYGNLKLRIDMNGNSLNNTPSCTDAGCAAEGFDCCIQGQCVNDASVKLAGKQSDPEGFNLAELEKATNPNWYLKYPEFYYICLEDPQNGGSDDPLDPADPLTDAEKRRLEMIADYECVEELKSNSVESPFHRDPVDESLPGSAYTKCEISDSSDPMYFESVMKRLYNNCGCAEQNDLDVMVDFCPAYTYKLEYAKDALGNNTTEIAGVSCVTPPNHDNQLPFQDLEVMVNSRSAPHRLFTAANGQQEGDPFQYLDNEKLFPLNGSFNMNSILGQMTLTLDQARPAKTVELEYDKVYYIAALEGYYTACPSCGKDSWFSNFSPFPSTQQGLGIRASGFTTSREKWGTNSSFANYEDAIFGRACWLPPTMVPFGHSPKADASEQRLSRLQSQAALYINGYQRDWFGFNRGALIGSFDGVTWFAIGKGRKVRATSDKLFLAINAPFADLASPTDHIVSVQEYDFITTAAQYDYDPEEEINSPFQNEAGLCQKYHQCETDSHCISKLGWEYSCVDVYQYQTKWPKFSPSGAEEVANDELSGALVQFLQQGELPPGSGSKRCVYRGAGAPCRVDLENVDDLNQRKAFACAPNFYCADLQSSDFNKEVARFGAPLENILESKNHYFGQDANVLGRPKDYIKTGSGSALPLDVQDALSENILLTDSSASGREGLCRPGKSLPSYAGAPAAGDTLNYDQLDQHDSKDSKHRTDFISQIGGCNSSLYTSLRYSSCPMLDAKGNYLHLSDEYRNIESEDITIEDSFATWNFSDRESVTKYYSTQQNMCGLESVNSDVSNIYALTEEQIRASSAFKSIEARTLASSDTQLEPTLAQNACFRRAGSVCHTDLDCSPNYKHFEILDLLQPKMLGNLAERKYWEEYLVCGQEQSEPILSLDATPEQLEAFNSYSFHNNRCGREVGKDITMYTEDSPNAPESKNLRTDIYGGFQPNDPDRYSRYAASLPQVEINFEGELAGKESILYPSRLSAKRPNDPTYNSGDPSILDSNQWKLIHDTGARTCAGGNWVRKFADGTNDWSRKRLHLDVSNFKCLNYRTPLILTKDPDKYFLKETDLSRDLINFCVDSGMNAAGCAQFVGSDEIGRIENFSSKTPPVLDKTLVTMKIDTDPEVMNNNNMWEENKWAFMQFLSYDSHPDPPYFNWASGYDNVNFEFAGKQVITTRIPSFIAFESINDIRIDLENPEPGKTQGLHENGAGPHDRPDSCKRLKYPSSYSCSTNDGWNGLCQTNDPLWDFDPAIPANTCDAADLCCYMYDENTRMLKVAYPQNVLDDTDDVNGNGDTDEDEYYGHKAHSLIVEFTAPGTLLWERQNADPVGAGEKLDDDKFLPHRRSSKPGNALYYLEKLARLEYIGIPQMTYEPIFCNDIYLKVVPGIFKDNIRVASDFIDNLNTFVDAKPFKSPYWDVPAGAVGDDNPENFWTDDELKKVADQELLAHEPIFSDHEFKCCLPLGAPLKENEDPSVCCSGAGKESDNGSSTCALPAGTDLNVYFNKFVSGEGLSSKYLKTAAPLIVEEFDEDTGEPKMSVTGVPAKLAALGKELCASGETVHGGVLGPFAGEPYGTLAPQDSDPVDVYSFVDSPYDLGTINTAHVGFDMFQAGYRWNHHIYCAPGGN